MELSKSILIFLFFSSISGAFFYAMRRTKGNILKSLLFALYFLAIKIGLIAPNIPLELNQDQPNQQLVSRAQLVAVYNPYVSILDEYRPSGLYMSNIEHPSVVPQHYNSQKLINELRAGDSRVRQAVWLLITIWMLHQQSVGFQPIKQPPMPPDIESARNLLFGKPKPDQFSCRQLSRFDSFETISKNSSDYRQKITFFDGFESETINRSLDHLLSKHGHNFGIHDPLPTNPKQKASPYLQPRTRTNVQNREQFFKNLNQFAQNPDLEVFKDVLIRGQLGRVYLCPETERVIAIAMEGPKAGTIIKAQPINEQQRTLLETQNKLD